MFSPDQFTHIFPPSILCITTPWYYFWGTTFIIRNWKCYGKKSEQRSACPNELVPYLAMRCLYQGMCGWGYIWPKVSLLKVVANLGMRCLYQGWGTSDQCCNKLGHKMSLWGVGMWGRVGAWGWGLVQVLGQGFIWPKISLHEVGPTWPQEVFMGVYIWPKVILLAVVPHLAKKCLYLGGVWPKVSLTWSSSKLGHKMLLPGGYIWPKVSLTQRLIKGQADLQ